MGTHISGGDATVRLDDGWYDHDSIAMGVSGCYGARSSYNKLAGDGRG